MPPRLIPPGNRQHKWYCKTVLQTFILQLPKRLPTDRQLGKCWPVWPLKCHWNENCVCILIKFNFYLQTLSTSFLANGSRKLHWNFASWAQNWWLSWHGQTVLWPHGLYYFEAELKIINLQHFPERPPDQGTRDSEMVPERAPDTLRPRMTSRSRDHETTTDS